uniref:Uncharacterized protein n=1 Tax=Euplotes harpa TaxID=151035 RepID=A0A7S3N4P6_9SPIT|mmetsp:Transcript_21257/g.24447  ORF Transcript_21257/g.24447 Transcript_21257/m.24447 type:complete len:186 (+) Transcript_21257:381-938(+)
MIKYCIKQIIENILPERMRILFKIVETGPKASHEEYKRLFELRKSIADFEVETKTYNDYDRMHYFTGVKPQVMLAVHRLNQITTGYKDKFKEEVHKLICVRNRILELQNLYRKEDSPDMYGLTAENIVNFMEYTKRLTYEKAYNIFNVYDIPVRNKTSVGHEGQNESLVMTDSDDEFEEIVEMKT